eukprot:scaffold6030_cov199-Amphora_coffeaeformis.AAC.14
MDTTQDQNSDETSSEKVTSIEGVQMVAYKVQVDIESPQQECFIPQDNVLKVQAICPTGAILVSPRAVEPCRLEDEHIVTCLGMNSFEFACYAEEAPANMIQPQVFVEPQEYYCDTFLRETSGVRNGMVLAVAYYGGTVEHSLTVKASLDGTTWTNTSTASCEDEFYCGLSYDGGACSGKKYRHLTVSETSITVSETKEAMLSSFTLTRAVGEECVYNTECQSKVCIQGHCASNLLPDGSPGCEEHIDCASGTCSGSSVEEAEQKVQCCASGHSLSFANDKADLGRTWVCTGQPEGATCFDDRLCASGVCLLNICASGKQDETMPCERHTHCQSGGCGILAPQANPSCCPYASTVQDKDGNTYCAGLDAKRLCSFDDVCAESTCALELHSLETRSICCPSGGKIKAVKPGSSFVDDYYCTGLLAGTLCGNDEIMCAVAAAGGTERACATRPTWTSYDDREAQVCCQSGRHQNRSDL